MGTGAVPPSRSPRSARENEVILLEDLALLSENSTLTYKKNVSELRVHFFLLFFFYQNILKAE